MTESRLSAVQRIEYAIDWPPGHVASYLLGGDELVLVDAGVPDESAPLTDALHAAGLRLADIDHVVLTHPHSDHLGQVPTVLAESDATVYAPLGVRDRLRRDPADLAAEVRANATRAGLSGERLETAVTMAVESLERNAALLPPDRVDVWVEDGDTIAPGGHELTAVHTPGHQADHLCYRGTVDGDRALFAGDMALEPFRAAAIHGGLTDAVSETFEAFYGALDTLAALEVDRVYPGHGPVHTAFGGTIERDRGSLDRRLRRVREALAPDGSTAPEVTTALAGDRSPEYVFIEVLGALSHLAATGAIGAERVDGVEVFSP
ncbi:MBL fold metallo-hydrolase [Natronomonas sp. EA1]|uniref:MBL fold metallo-hydrolase n=1 Tax=Natronomonas sp. EA1 TaxID=3421655 RepID=UPI003EBFF2B5